MMMKFRLQDLGSIFFGVVNTPYCVYHTHYGYKYIEKQKSLVENLEEFYSLY